MRILHILDHSIPLQSGYTFRTRNILRQQQNMGWYTAHVTGLKHIGVNQLEEDVDGLHFYRTIKEGKFLSNAPLLNQWRVIHTLAKRIEDVIEKEHPDILHAHSPALNGMAALQANKKFKLPLVYECRAFWEDAAVDHGTSREHGIRYRMSHALETSVFKKVDAVTTICEGLKGDILQRGISSQKVTVIPNAVDIDQFVVGTSADNYLSEKLGIKGKVVLGFIGSFYAYEGIPLLLESLPKMLAQNPDICLLLVGGGPQEGLIKSEVARLGLKNSVIMTGRVAHGEIGKYYDLVNIFVYPRLSMRLTDLVTPLKPLEAMAQGKLVVASDVGGHRELISHGQNGHLFTANSVSSLCETVCDLLERQQDWPRIRANGRIFVEECRNWKNSVERYQPV